jgi:hypothetical protein
MRAIINLLILFLIFTAMSLRAHAADGKPTKNSKPNIQVIQALAGEYFLQQSAQKSEKDWGAPTVRPNPPYCPPHQPSLGCAEAVCQHVSSYDCNDQSDLTRIAQMCRGNWDGSCINEACSHLSSYDCNDLSDLERIAASCAGQNGACMKEVCSRVSSYDCNDLSDLDRIGKMCQGNWDGSCIQFVCSKLSSYDCDDLNDLEPIARSCAGQK